MKTLSAVTVCLLLATPAAASAEEAPPSGVLTRAPAVLQPVEPEYPAEARAHGLAAGVGLELDIAETGEVIDARVVAPAGHGFDESALAAAKKLRFLPAEIDGKPAAVRIEFRFNFELMTAPVPEASGATADTAPGPAAPLVNFRGVILERGTKTPLVGAMIEVADGAQLAYSDEKGYFELAGVPLGRARVVVIENNHQRFETTEDIEAGKTLEVKYYLLKSAKGAFETVVVGQKEKKEVAVVALSASEVTKIPGVSGDTVKVVQNLPGAARAPGGMGMLVLRGGNPLDTRVYIDGFEMPLIFHFGGLTSVYSSELIQDVEYEPGNFGVRYGRATAGRVELKSRDPNSAQLHALADVNLYHATALVEGPVSDTVSVAIAGRRSYVDGLLNLAKDRIDGIGFAVAPRYYDYQGKLTWRPTRKDTLRISLFGSDDLMKLVGLETGGLEDIDALNMLERVTVFSTSYEHQFSPGTRVRLGLAEQYFDIRMKVAGFMDETERIAATLLRGDGTYEVSKTLSLGAGVDMRYMPWSRLDLTIPHIPRADEIPSDMTMVHWNQKLTALEAGLWAEAVWKPLEPLVLVPGVRLDYSDVVGALTWVDPRFNARFALRDGTTLKGGVGRYHQPPETAYRTEQWGNPDLKQEGSTQYSLGVEQRLHRNISLDVQLYYKSMFNLATPSTATVERDGQEVAERFNNSGSGKAYGAEVLLRYNPDGRFFGWISYSLSRTTRDTSVSGGRFDSTGDQFDQPHNLVALGTLQLPELLNGLSVGFRLHYTSGNPYAPVLGAVYDVDGDQFTSISSPKLSERQPAFFQLDLRADKEWTFERWKLAAYLDVQNVTNRKNPEGLAYNHDFTEQGWTTGLPIFPSLGLRAEY